MKTVLITGAAGALGSAIVTKFAADGYNVIGIVNHAQAPAGNNVELMQANLTDEAATGEAVQNIVARYGSIDVLIATAGGFAMGDIAATKLSDIAAQNEINFQTAYNISRPVFGHMKERGNGRIFLVGSRPGLSAHNGKGMVAYGLAKSLLTYLAELMNDEAKSTDVITTLVVPSIIDTPTNRKMMATADFSGWVTPESIAGAIHFYCSDAAADIREPVIKVYGNS